MGLRTAWAYPSLRLVDDYNDLVLHAAVLAENVFHGLELVLLISEGGVRRLYHEFYSASPGGVVHLQVPDIS